MPYHRTISRRIPDWQVDCIDGKAKWLVPWAIFAVLLGVSMTRTLAPWFLDGETLKFKYEQEFHLHLAAGGNFTGPEVLSVRIDDAQNVHVGGTILEFVIPVQAQQITDPSWRREVRSLLQREVKQRTKVSTLLIEAAPNVSWEVVATIAASVRNISRATQYLQVNEK